MTGQGFCADGDGGDSGRVTPPAPLQNYRLHDHKATAPLRGICSLGGAALNTGPSKSPSVSMSWDLGKGSKEMHGALRPAPPSCCRQQAFIRGEPSETLFQIGNRRFKIVATGPERSCQD